MSKNNRYKSNSNNNLEEENVIVTEEDIEDNTSITEEESVESEEVIEDLTKNDTTEEKKEEVKVKESDIEVLERRIAYWTEKLNNCKNNVECGLLSDKILKAKKDLSILKANIDDTKTVVKDESAPSVSDSKSSKRELLISRGQVIGDNAVYTFMV